MAKLVCLYLPQMQRNRGHWRMHTSAIDGAAFERENIAMTNFGQKFVSRCQIRMVRRESEVVFLLPKLAQLISFVGIFLGFEELHWNVNDRSATKRPFAVCFAYVYIWIRPCYARMFWQSRIVWLSERKGSSNAIAQWLEWEKRSVNPKYTNCVTKQIVDVQCQIVDGILRTANKLTNRFLYGN